MHREIKSDTMDNQLSNHIICNTSSREKNHPKMVMTRSTTDAMPQNESCASSSKHSNVDSSKLLMPLTSSTNQIWKSVSSCLDVDKDNAEDDEEIMILDPYQHASASMELPEPFVCTRNKNFIVPEDCSQLTQLIRSSPLQVQPLGYYRTPDGFDMYVRTRTPIYYIYRRRWRYFLLIFFTSQKTRKTQIRTVPRHHIYIYIYIYSSTWDVKYDIREELNH